MLNFDLILEIYMNATPENIKEVVPESVRFDETFAYHWLNKVLNEYDRVKGYDPDKNKTKVAHFTRNRYHEKVMQLVCPEPTAEEVESYAERERQRAAELKPLVEAYMLAMKNKK